MSEDDGITMPPPDQDPASDPAVGSVVSMHDRRGVGARAVLVLAIALALAATGTVFALRSAGGGPPLDALVPSTTVAFVEVALDPPGSQRDALGALIDRLPEQDRAKVGPAIEGMLNDVFGELGLSFTDDVKPWVGARAGLAVPKLDAGLVAGRPPDVVGLLHVRDEGAARAALGRALDAAGAGGAFDVAGGVAYIASSQQAIADLRSAATSGTPLSEDPAYRSVRAGLGEDGLAWIWTAGVGSLGSLVPQPAGTGPQGPAGAVLRATADGIELVGSGSSGGTTKGQRPALLESSAPGLLASLTWIDPGTTLATFLESFEQVAPLLAPGGDPVADTEDRIGLDLLEDVVPWLHGEVSVVLGGFTTPPIPDAAILIEPTNERALSRTLRAIGDRLEMLGRDLGGRLRRDADGFTFEADGFGAVVRREPGTLVIATSEAYARRLLDGTSPSLGDDAVYRRAVGDSTEGTMFQVYVRLDQIGTLLGLALPPDARAAYEDGPDAFLALFQTLSVTAQTTSSGSTFRVALTTAP